MGVVVGVLCRGRAVVVAVSRVKLLRTVVS
jgi:hypothetical protein